MGLSSRLPIAWNDGHICESLPISTHMAVNLGIFVLYIPLSCISSPCNLLFLNLGVQLFSHFPLVTCGWYNEGTIGEEGPICGVGVHEGWAGGHTPLCPPPKNRVQASSSGDRLYKGPGGGGYQNTKYPRMKGRRTYRLLPIKFVACQSLCHRPASAVRGLHRLPAPS